ncbi:MAG: hypothetical protein IT285_12420 [Bdellovibrionales bacterium]|nr:hypothetical protein [Bdellovibrionales bacterium]
MWGIALYQSLENALATRALYRSIVDEPFTEGLRTRWHMDYVTAAQPERVVSHSPRIEAAASGDVGASDLVLRFVV